MKELLEGIALEGGFHSLKRKKESRRKFLNRWCAGVRVETLCLVCAAFVPTRVIDSAWDAVREGVDAEIGSKD